MSGDGFSRRTVLKGIGAGAALAGLPVGTASSASAAAVPELITKPIPSSGEEIPVVGMGTWQTFNVGRDEKLRKDRSKVLTAFFEMGGGLVDSSPMYGSSQDVVGYCLDALGHPDGLFSADKVWTSDGSATRSQTATSRDKWQIEAFDLMQVHNLRAWEPHLDTLQKMKEKGDLRYVGITTSHGRRHGEFAEVMRKRELDFVQLTYSLGNRRVEDRLLPLAREQEIAVIANRPFAGGSLVDRFQDQEAPLPDWAEEWGISNWPQFLLKFIVSHPAVTCAIPATTQVEHMRENMGAARGELPDSSTRERMAEYASAY